MAKTQADILREKREILEFYFEHKDVIRLLLDEFCSQQLQELSKVQKPIYLVTTQQANKCQSPMENKRKYSIENKLANSKDSFEDIFSTQELQEIDAWILANKDTFKQRKTAKNDSFVKDYDFNDFFARLCRYYEQNGTLRIKNNYIDFDGYALGQKAYQIRKYVHTGSQGIKISANQKMILERIGFSFDINDAKFKDIVSRMLNYQEKYRDNRIKSTYRDDDGFLLGKKLMQIRKGIFEIDEAQRNQLADLGFEWDVGKTWCFNNIETQYCSALSIYHKENGDSFVPFDYVDDEDFELGLETLRILQGTIYQDVGYKLNSKQQQKLTRLGFCWDLNEWQGKLANFYDQDTLNIMLKDRKSIERAM